MCVMSMIIDHYNEKWQPYMPKQWPIIQETPSNIKFPKFPTKEELDEFWKLYERAKEYDRKNHEPDCETKEKIDKLLDLAKSLNIEEEVKKIIEGKYKI